MLFAGLVFYGCQRENEIAGGVDFLEMPVETTQAFRPEASDFTLKHVEVVKEYRPADIRGHDNLGALQVLTRNRDGELSAISFSVFMDERNVFDALMPAAGDSLCELTPGLYDLHLHHSYLHLPDLYRIEIRKGQLTRIIIPLTSRLIVQGHAAHSEFSVFDDASFEQISRVLFLERHGKCSLDMIPGEYFLYLETKEGKGEHFQLSADQEYTIHLTD